MDIFLKILLGCIYARLLPNHLCSLKKHAMVDFFCSLIFDLPLQPNLLHLSTKFIFWIFFQFWHFIILFCLVIWSLGWWHLDEQSVFDTCINIHLKCLGPSCQFYFPSPNWIVLNWHGAKINSFLSVRTHQRNLWNALVEGQAIKLCFNGLRLQAEANKTLSVTMEWDFDSLVGPFQITWLLKWGFLANSCNCVFLTAS